MKSWSARPLGAFLVLAVLFCTVPPVLAETTVHVCPACANTTQISQEALTWGRAHMSHYQLFIVTGAAPYTLQGCFQRLYQPYYGLDTVTSMPASQCANPGPPLADPTDVINPAYYTSNRYYVKVADFNADGRLDLFVTGSSTRAVGDFIVLQQPSWKWTIAATPTAAQLQIAASAPVTSVTVNRTDFTSDGVLDFEFEDVDEAIPGAPGVIVLTQKWNGTPKLGVTRDSTFEKLADALEAILSNFDQMASLYRASYCTIFTIYIPAPAPLFPDSPLAGFVEGEWSWSGGNWGYQPYIQSACWSGSQLFSPQGRKLMDSILSLQPGPDPATEARARQIVEQILRRVSIRAQLGRALIIRAGAIESSAVILGDDVTVVGVADDWGLILTLAMTGYTTWEISRYNDYLAGGIDEDEGVNPQPAATPDPYGVKSGCNPWDSTVLANQTSAKVGRPAPKAPQSWRLRSNLEKAGCGCPEGRNTNAAHHIIEKGDTDLNSIAARECLDRAGIDVDWAGNGICLPTNDNAPTNAFRHNDIHSNAYKLSIRELCEAAYSQGGAAGVRNMLDDVRIHLSRGEQFW